MEALVKHRLPLSFSGSQTPSVGSGKGIDAAFPMLNDSDLIMNQVQELSPYELRQG